MKRGKCLVKFNTFDNIMSETVTIFCITFKSECQLWAFPLQISTGIEAWLYCWKQVCYPLCIDASSSAFNHTTIRKLNYEKSFDNYCVHSGYHGFFCVHIIYDLDLWGYSAVLWKLRGTMNNEQHFSGDS